MSLDEVRKLAASGKLAIGTELSLKGLKSGAISKIFVSKNCPDRIKQDISHLAGIGKIEVEMLEVTNEELGVACKKQFAVSVAGLKK